MTVETRPVKELIDEVRFNTNNTDDNRFDDSRLIKLFNSALKQVQKVIFNSNPVNSPFQEQVELSLQSGVNSYELPDDIFATASVRDVVPVNFNGKATKALRHMTAKEQNTQRGYYLTKNIITFAPTTLPNEYKTIVVTYDKVIEPIENVNDEIAIPATCEDFLMAFVERKINYIDSSKDLSNSQVFTQEEKDDLISLFKEEIKDIKYPPIVDETYYSY